MRGVDLSTEDCIANEFQPKDFSFVSDEYNTIVFTHEELCNYFATKLERVPHIINPNALILTPDPPVTEEIGGIKGSYNPPVVENNKLEIRGKNILIVGGAKNIGFSLSRRLHQEGAKVTATSRYPECFPPTPYQLEQLDVRTDEEVNQFIHNYVQYNKKIDILIILPAMMTFGRLQDYSGNDLLAALNILLVGHQRVVKAALPYMRHSNETRIISFGSTMSEFNFGFGGGAIYSIAKKAMQHWNVTMQTEEMHRKAFGEIRYGPTFIVVEPYWVDSTIGLYEFFKPSDVKVDDPDSMGIHNVISSGQSGGTHHSANYVADAIVRILQAPQPTIHYILYQEDQKEERESLTLLGIKQKVNSAQVANVVRSLPPTTRVNFLNQYGASSIDAIKDAQRKDYQRFCNQHH